MTKPIDPKLAKFIAESKIKDRLYHSTSGNFSEFDPSKDVRGSKLSFVSDQPYYHPDKEHTTIMPLHAQVKKIFDASKSIPKQTVEWIHNNADLIHKELSNYNNDFGLAYHAHQYFDKDEPLNPKKYINHIKSGDWQAVEAVPSLIKHIQSLGHDAIKFYEDGSNTYGIFDPRKIKSAIGNRGTYDPTDPDITKAKGGSVMGINVASDRMHGLSYADLIVDGHKVLESRDSDTLRPYVGKRVAIVRTRSGPAKAIGEVTIGQPMVVNKKKFRSMEDQHLVPEGSAFDITTPTKHLYPMHDPVRYEKEKDVGRGIKARKVINMAKGGKVEVRPTVFDDAASRRNPNIEAAALAMMKGELKQKAYAKLVAKEKPVKAYDFIPKPATDEQAMDVLLDRQKQNWKSHNRWPAGRRVGLRLDIPAYERYGVWVNSVHDEEGSGEHKLPNSYGPVSSVRNATFEGSPDKAIRVATGEQNKNSFARIKGELEHIDEDQAVKHFQKYMHHPDYRQVGYDPRRHGDFYDRETMQPITHSEHVVQIGPLVLAKNPKYGKPTLYAKGGVARMAVGGPNWSPHPENDLLQPIGSSKMVGDEKLVSDDGDFKSGLSMFPSNKKSYRYVYHDEDQTPVGAMQIATQGPRSKKAVIQNLYVAEANRRQGIASKLLDRARKDFDVKHSDDLTTAGKAFAKAKKAHGGRVTHAHHLNIEERPL